MLCRMIWKTRPEKSHSRENWDKILPGIVDTKLVLITINQISSASKKTQHGQPYFKIMFDMDPIII